MNPPRLHLPEHLDYSSSREEIRRHSRTPLLKLRIIFLGKGMIAWMKYSYSSILEIFRYLALSILVPLALALIFIGIPSFVSAYTRDPNSSVEPTLMKTLVVAGIGVVVMLIVCRMVFVDNIKSVFNLNPIRWAKNDYETLKFQCSLENERERLERNFLRQLRDWAESVCGVDLSKASNQEMDLAVFAARLPEWEKAHEAEGWVKLWEKSLAEMISWLKNEFERGDSPYTNGREYLLEDKVSDTSLSHRNHTSNLAGAEYEVVRSGGKWVAIKSEFNFYGLLED